MKKLSGFGVIPRILWVLTPLLVAGCDECWDRSCCGEGWDTDNTAPYVPVGLRSVTGDGEVYLSWMANQDEDLDGYRVYVSGQPDGPYESIGESRNTHFVDHGARNGHTYYYAVAAYDYCGNESELSYENVHDTPRPEGFGLVLAAAGEGQGRDSGYDFSTYRRQAPLDPGTDIYYLVSGGVPWMVAATSQVGVQDVGYLPLEDLDWAPDRGWSESGRVELTVGHTYAVRTADGHYAKFFARSVDRDRVTIDWAFQIDRGNRELSIGIPATVASANGATPPGTGKGGSNAPASQGGDIR